jgi:AAA15 family ATPase/GTPase
MLLSFRCKNFRSISEEQEITLVAQKTRSDERNESLLELPIAGEKGLRCAAIYGSNASGKSNVLRAMRAFSNMISESQRQWKPTGGIPTWDPFALDEVSKSAETKFQIDFVIASTVYRYGFTFNARTIIDEQLTDITGRPKVLFHRISDGSSISISFPGKNLGGTSDDQKHLELIRVQTRANSLFLSSAAQSNHERLSALYKWLSDSFYILSPRDQSAPRYTAELCSTPHRKKQIKALLAFADTGIVDIEVAEEEAPEKEKKLWNAMFNAFREVEPENAANLEAPPFVSRRHSITMSHRGAGGNSYQLDFHEESAGTKAYFYMLGPLLNELEEGTLVLIDELESSLHPNLARQFLRIFNDPLLNPKGAQLIFASHDTNLLDLDLLRRDQIWFTEKNQQGATALSQLSDFKPRKEQNIAAAYLHGRFGATPFLDEDLLRVAFSKELETSVIGANEDE